MVAASRTAQHPAHGALAGWEGASEVVLTVTPWVAGRFDVARRRTRRLGRYRPLKSWPPDQGGLLRVRSLDSRTKAASALGQGTAARLGGRGWWFRTADKPSSVPIYADSVNRYCACMIGSSDEMDGRRVSRLWAHLYLSFVGIGSVDRGEELRRQGTGDRLEVETVGEVGERVFFVDGAASSRRTDDGAS